MLEEKGPHLLEEKVCDGQMYVKRGLAKLHNPHILTRHHGKTRPDL